MYKNVAQKREVIMKRATRTMAERFCRVANLFLLLYRECSGKVSPAGMINSGFWAEYAQGDKRWYSKVRGQLVISGEEESLIQRAAIIKRMLKQDEEWRSDKGDKLGFKDGSETRAIWAPGAFRKKEWFWGLRVVKKEKD